MYTGKRTQAKTKPQWEKTGNRRKRHLNACTCVWNTHTYRTFLLKVTWVQYINKRRLKMSFDMKLQIHQYSSDQYYELLPGYSWMGPMWEHADRESSFDSHQVTRRHTHTHWRSHPQISYLRSISLLWLGGAAMNKHFSLFIHTNRHTRSITIMWKGHLVTESVHRYLSNEVQAVCCVHINL